MFMLAVLPVPVVLDRIMRHADDLLTRQVKTSTLLFVISYGNPRLVMIMIISTVECLFFMSM